MQSGPCANARLGLEAPTRTMVPSVRSPRVQLRRQLAAERARLKLGFSFMCIAHVAEQCLAFFSGAIDAGAAIVELTPLPFVGALRAVAAWKLSSRQTREAIDRPGS